MENNQALSRHPRGSSPREVGEQDYHVHASRLRPGGMGDVSGEQRMKKAEGAE